MTDSIDENKTPAEEPTQKKAPAKRTTTRRTTKKADAAE